MNKKELFEFCTRWLSAWTGNRPDELIQFYSEDALYVDPANREGLKGKSEIKLYFEKLLDFYRDWKWEPLEVFPIESGAIVKWKCKIPLESETLLEVGLDILELEGNKIIRNEVYFDRTRLLAAVERKRKKQLTTR